MKPLQHLVVHCPSIRVTLLALAMASSSCRRTAPTQTQPGGNGIEPGNRDLPALDAGSNEPIGPIAQLPPAAGGSVTTPTLPPILPPAGGSGGYGGTNSPIGTIARR
ncbi:MAG: hypothetical protein QM784_08420 [Polyangiaceae bacterium]